MPDDPLAQPKQPKGFLRSLLQDESLSPLLTTLVLAFVCLLAVSPVFLFHWHVKPLGAVGLFVLMMVVPFIPVCRVIERWRAGYIRRIEARANLPE